MFQLSGLKDLLDYQDPDVEEVFCLNFTITEEFFGDTRVVDLKVSAPFCFKKEPVKNPICMF